MPVGNAFTLGVTHYLCDSTGTAHSSCIYENIPAQRAFFLSK